MFICRFNQTTNHETFRASRTTGELPFIGTVLAGTFHSSIMNAGSAAIQGIKEGKLYACENVPSVNRETGELIRTQAGEQVYDVQIVAEVSVLELVALKKELGAPFRLQTNKVTQEEVTPDVSATSAPELKQAIEEEVI